MCKADSDKQTSTKQAISTLHKWQVDTSHATQSCSRSKAANTSALNLLLAAVATKARQSATVYDYRWYATKTEFRIQHQSTEACLMSYITHCSTTALPVILYMMSKELKRSLVMKKPNFRGQKRLKRWYYSVDKNKMMRKVYRKKSLEVHGRHCCQKLVNNTAFKHSNY